MHITFALVPGASTSGYYEYACIKYQRQTSVPQIGVDPVPTSAVIQTDGLQKATRSLSPGWVYKFGIIPATSETTLTRTITVDWKKFKVGKVRDGDFFTILIFNRTGTGGGVYDLQIRYITY